MSISQAYRNINTIEGEVIDLLDSRLNHFLLLDSWKLADYVNCDQSEDSFDPKFELTEIISGLDPFTSTSLVWEHTFLEKHARVGPLLVELEHDSPLIEHYTENWAPAHLGLLLTSPMSKRDLLVHFRSLVVVNLPDGNQARLRFQDPKKVTAAFAALTETRCSSLMGPLKQVVWREDIGKDHRWLLAENHQPLAPVHQESRWFQFCKKEMEIINQFNQHHLVNNLVKEIISIIDEKKIRQETQGIEYLINASEARIRVLVEKGIEYGGKIRINDADQVKRFVKLALFHEPLLKKQAIKRVLCDTAKQADARLHQIEDHVLAGAG